MSHRQFELCRYNFNNDGFVSKEDIRIMLSYVPFQPEIDDPEADARSHGSKGSEGLYNSRQLSFERRQADQEEINKFIDQIFASKNFITFKEY